MKATELDVTSYEDFVGQSGVVVVDFWAEWCAPCKAMKPVMESLSSKYNVGMVNIDDNGTLAASHQVSSLPQFIIYKDGVEVDRIAGALPPKLLEDRILKAA